MRFGALVQDGRMSLDRVETGISALSLGLRNAAHVSISQIRQRYCYRDGAHTGALGWGPMRRADEGLGGCVRPVLYHDVGGASRPHPEARLKKAAILDQEVALGVGSDRFSGLDRCRRVHGGLEANTHEVNHRGRSRTPQIAQDALRDALSADAARNCLYVCRSL